MATVLLVDDEAAIREMLSVHLSLANYQCLCAEDAVQARELLHRHPIDIVLLDVMMPGEDGFSLAPTFFKQKIPVLFLTAKTDVTDRVKGLLSGAEDYILKPFEPAELLARIEVILRRTQKADGYQDTFLSIDYQARSICFKNMPVAVTALEFDLLALLTKHEGQAFSRESLLAKVWGYDYMGETRTVDVHVQRLRKKLGPDAIETIYKYGYRYTRKGNA